MNNQGATGIASAILLISFILIGATAASVILGDAGEDSYEENYEEMLEEVIDEISTYIQIKDVIGKYNSAPEEQHIQQITILIKPLFSINIDASGLMIKLNNGQQVKMLYYDRQSEFIESQSLFEHSIWDNITDTNFSFIALLDKDRSIVDYDVINDNTDMAYIILKLPEDFTMEKGDILEITLFPSTGITKIITVEAPLPINQIVPLI